MSAVPALAAVFSAVAASGLVLAAANAAQSDAGGRSIARVRTRISYTFFQWREMFALLLSEGRVDGAMGQRRASLGAASVAAMVGFSLVGPLGAVLGAATVPLVWRHVLRARRARYAKRIDAGCAELATALAAALAAGNSVRGALLVAGTTTPEPLAAELQKLGVDLALGNSVSDALAGLRGRTNSTRIESLVGAIELHQGSGGDLILLVRDLSDAFRARDRAIRDAQSATVQARYTAGVVAAMPLGMGVICELAKPGSVTGALNYLPTAVMLVLAASVMALGTVGSWRIGSV
ncbi:MAG: type II secretion system F family protein [Solirubrobacterales bacterium]